MITLYVNWFCLSCGVCQINCIFLSPFKWVLSCCVPLDPVQISDCWIVTLIIIIIYVISSQYGVQMVTFSITEQSSLFVQSTCSWNGNKRQHVSFCMFITHCKWQFRSSTSEKMRDDERVLKNFSIKHIWILLLVLQILSLYIQLNTKDLLFFSLQPISFFLSRNLKFILTKRGHANEL